jgi:hypothetical protein
VAKSEALVGVARLLLRLWCFAVDAVGGSMRLVQSSRLSEEETMRLYDGSEELVAGAVVKARRGGD